jgi:hypothetical protein
MATEGHLMPRALGVGACLVIVAAVALAALALAFNLTSDLGSDHFDDAGRADVSAYVLVFLGMALAAAARGTGGVGRRGGLRVAAAAATANASALAACIVGVVWAFRTSGFQLADAYAVVSFARTLAFAALALGVLGTALVWRKAVALAALLGVAALVSLAVGLIHASYNPLLSLATTLMVLAAAVAVSARQPDAGAALGPR